MTIIQLASSPVLDLDHWFNEVPSAIVEDLAGYGIAGLPDPTSILLLRLAPPAPEKPASLVGLTEDELAAYRDKLAQHAAVLNGARSAAGQIEREFEEDLTGWLREHEDRIVDSLEAAWRPHIDAFQRVLDAGVLPTDSAEQLLDHPVETQRAWKELSGHAEHIRAAARVRMHLATILRTAPMPKAGHPHPKFVDWGLALTSPYWSEAFTTDDGGNLVRACLRLAPRLGMRHTSDLDGADVVIASGVPSDELRRQLPAGYAWSEVTEGQDG